jgi:hypothetical protein
MRDDLPGHTLHGGPECTHLSNCVRARRCTPVHPGRRRGSTRQRRVPALHNGSQRTAMRTPWQRRVPRALVHRGRPRGWAHVTCGGGSRRPPKTRRARQLPAAAREGAGGASRTLASFGRIVVARHHRTGDQLPAAALEGAGGASRTLASFGRIVVARHHRDGKVGARTRLSRGATSAAGLVCGRRETMRSNGTSVRLAPPAPSRAAAGSRSGRHGWWRRLTT